MRIYRTISKKKHLSWRRIILHFLSKIIILKEISKPTKNSTENEPMELRGKMYSPECSLLPKNMHLGPKYISNESELVKLPIDDEQLYHEKTMIESISG